MARVCLKADFNLIQVIKLAPQHVQCLGAQQEPQSATSKAIKKLETPMGLPWEPFSALVHEHIVVLWSLLK